MKIRKMTKSLMLVTVFSIVLFASYLRYQSTASRTPSPQVPQSGSLFSNQLPQPGSPLIGISSIMGSDITDPSRAAINGISGYVSIDLATPVTSKVISVSGGKASVQIALKFVSYWANLTSTEVYLDPHGSGISVSIPYGNSLFYLNDLVSYSPSGTVTIKAGQTLLVTLTVTVPANYPVLSFPLAAVGVNSQSYMIDNLDGTVNV